jgi:RNA polymerase sigma-70 factor (ECF subfamily)
VEPSSQRKLAPGEAPVRPMLKIDDELILRLLRRGDFRAIDLLAKNYGGRILGFVGNILQDSAAAEDICHDVFVKLFERHVDCRDVGAFSTWIFRIARNMALDRLRRNEIHKRVLRNIERSQLANDGVHSFRERTPGPLEEMERAEMQEKFEDALLALPEHFRTIFVLREKEEMSYTQIAEVCDITEKTVSTRLFRARRELRDLLRPYLDGKKAGGPQA